VVETAKNTFEYFGDHPPGRPRETR
jgi:hypothetical protein